MLFYRNPFKYLSFLLLFFWIAAPVASCQFYPEKAPVKDTAVSALNQQQPPDSLPGPVGYVNDFEDLFTNSQEQTLDSLLRDFDARTSIQIAVISIDSSMTTKDSLDAYTLKIFRAWGPGQKEKNNGMVIGISKVFSKMRIENGYGIEKILTDAATKEIIDKAFIPGFREAAYFQGTLTGLQSLMKILEQRSR